MALIDITELTSGSITGTGAFDELMEAAKLHLEQEYAKGRIKGPEYSQVYLGSLQAVMQQALQFVLEKQRADKQAELLTAQALTEAKQQAVLVAQECKLRAEYDLILEQTLKTAAETALLAQKKVTETAQVSGTGVAPDSVIGKQKGLYQAQTDGFARDAEQKAAKLMVDSWNVRRTTDEGTVADTVNRLSDANIGQVVQRLIDGINA